MLIAIDSKYIQPLFFANIHRNKQIYKKYDIQRYRK